MFPSRRGTGARRSRGSHSRHGRALRSSVAGPHLPQLTGRIPRFNQVVGETLGFLRAMAPELMNDVRVLIAPMPVGDREREQLDRWEVREPNEVIVYRVPIERLANIPLSDARQQARYREYVEHTVMLAVNDLLRGGLDDILHHGH